MPSVVDICNNALSHTGTDAFIQSLDETSKEGKLCKRWYETTRDRMLRRFPWNFAQRRQLLADMGDPPSGWGYRYRYPSNAVFIQHVYPKGDWRATYSNNEVIARLAPWEVASSGDGGRTILSNVPEAEAVFTVQVTDPNLFDPLFTDALEFAIASNIAMPLVSSAEIMEYLRNKVREVMSEAMQVNLTEAKEPPEMEAPSVRARFGTFAEQDERYV